jgi:hypothetical protein
MKSTANRRGLPGMFKTGPASGSKIYRQDFYYLMTFIHSINSNQQSRYLPFNAMCSSQNILWRNQNAGATVWRVLSHV